MGEAELVGSVETGDDNESGGLISKMEDKNWKDSVDTTAREVENET